MAALVSVGLHPARRAPGAGAQQPATAGLLAERDGRRARHGAERAHRRRCCAAAPSGSTPSASRGSGTAAGSWWCCASPRSGARFAISCEPAGLGRTRIAGRRGVADPPRRARGRARGRDQRGAGGRGDVVRGRAGQSSAAPTAWRPRPGTSMASASNTRPSSSDFARVRPTSPEACFRMQTLLVHAWRKFPFLDPDLPSELLPGGWPRRRAHELFLERHARWQPAARDYFDALEQDRAAARRGRGGMTPSAIDFPGGELEVIDIPGDPSVPAARADARRPRVGPAVGRVPAQGRRRHRLPDGRVLPPRPRLVRPARRSRRTPRFMHEEARGVLPELADATGSRRIRSWSGTATAPRSR